ncbi:P-loop containing nucleoside triphosphate hydrolase protein [Lyophyllum atratum]|nr:P-loop containing nucleoside triphosphate hydrolase protein [Lyophyllum atratum]
MPSHTGASALVKLYMLSYAPWSWPTWQEHTGVAHGLFPDDDKLLPRGWSRQNAINVQSYFKAYSLLPSEDKKIAFAVNSKGSSKYPGREFWNAWVNRRWDSWGIHTLIIKVLKEIELHPVDIIARDDDLDNWPSADNYIPAVVDDVGMRLFGEEAFPSGSSVLSSSLRAAVRIIVQRTWNTLRLQVSTMKNRRNEIEATAKAAFADLENGKLTKAKVSRTIHAVAKWKECSTLFNTARNVEAAESMLADLEEIMEGLGAKLGKRTKSKGERAAPRTCKVSAIDLKNLATEEDVTDLVHMYHEYFDGDVEDPDEEPVIAKAPTDRQKLNDAGGDFGMDVEATMTFGKLAGSLGWRTGIPPTFNSLRDRFGTTPWDDPTPFESEPKPANIEPLRLHWHQLAGTHSIVRSLFTESKNPDRVLGVLVGDKVGLGKSAQAIAFMAFLMQVAWLKKHKKKLPRVLEQRMYLGGKRNIPSAPHLILCPGTLVPQWVSELKVFFQRKKVEILVYDSQTDAAQFWGLEGPVQKSAHEARSIIIVASHSVLFKEMNDCHMASKKKKGARPWDMPKARPSQTFVDTLFGQEFLIVVVDEAHHMRNAGRKHSAILRLLQQAKIRLIMTATPLHTSFKDLSAMGRLVGLPHFYTEEAFQDEKDDAAAVRKAKALDDDGQSLLVVQLLAVKRLQARLGDHFLRRTTSSLDSQGNPLLPLPPYDEILGVLELTQREREVIQARAEAAKASVETSNASGLATRRFYLEYRTAVGFSKEDPAAPFPSFRSLAEWLPVKSTKMEVTAQVCKHYLRDDSVGDVEFVDGHPVFPDIPDIPPDRVQQKRRIIIYAEFSSMAPLLQNVLRLHGIESLALNGKTSIENRNKHVRNLYDDKHPARVLIFSSVGSAGLNLAIADVLIFFDQPWSAQDERQTRGRAHRQPQKKTVKVIHLLASDSADLLMNDVARGKRDMFDAFVNKELRDGMCLPHF